MNTGTARSTLVLHMMAGGLGRPTLACGGGDTSPTPTLVPTPAGA